MKALKKLTSSLRKRKIRRQVTSGLKLIASAERLMQKEGWPRYERRRFWREFISKANKLDSIGGLFDKGKE